MNTTWKVILSILCILSLIFIGFIIGRNSVTTTTTSDVKYIKGDVIRDSIPVPYPVKEIIPPDTLDVIRKCVESGRYAEFFPERVRDSIIYIDKRDTAAVLKDWGTERFYTETLFDNDTIGNCKISTRIQYNRMYDLKYTFTPVTKQVNTNTVITRTFEPFVGVGVFTNSSINLQVGTYFKQHYGVSYMPIYDIKNKTWIHGLNVTYKF